MRRAAPVTRRRILLVLAAAPLCRLRHSTMRVRRLDPARVGRMAAWAG